MKDIRNLKLPALHTMVTQQEFNNIISNFYELIFNLTEKNSNLRKTRDLLLPKLISGEIDVESLDAAIEADMGELAA